MQMAELNEEYRKTTDSLLRDVRIKIDWDESVVSVYESAVPEVAVPGSLEFIGLYRPVEKLMQKGLRVYAGFDGNLLMIYLQV